MFEKEAEEYTKIHYDFLENRDAVENIWQDGAEFGYNKRIEELEKENARMRELLKTLSESIVMTADDTFWSLRDDVEKFFEGEEYEEH